MHRLVSDATLPGELAARQPVLCALRSIVRLYRCQACGGAFRVMVAEPADSAAATDRMAADDERP